MEQISPDIGIMGGPIWWHHHGSKMKIAAQGRCNDLLLLQGSAAELLIKKHQTNWLVTWKIIQGPQTIISGAAIFPNKELLAAFGGHYDTPSHSAWLINRYGGSAAHQGLFIRFQNWLNIPCPGTGNDGDPNISIELGTEMLKSAIDLVYHNR